MLKMSYNPKEFSVLWKGILQRSLHDWTNIIHWEEALSFPYLSKLAVRYAYVSGFQFLLCFKTFGWCPWR